MANLKIEIKSWTGSVLFSYESEDNTAKKTLEKAVSAGADLKGAHLKGAYLEGAYLEGADLKGAYLEGAYLEGADLSHANLSHANLSHADLSHADLSHANLIYANLIYAELRQVKKKDIPIWWKNACSRDMLFVFEHLKPELPFLKEKLMQGKVDGTQYKGTCACLIGTLANADGGLDKVCSAIPFYTKGLENYGEQWFWNIREGDTPKTSHFARHAIELIEMVEAKPKKAKPEKKVSK